MLNIYNDSLVYIDIETVPTQDPEVAKRIAATVAPPGNYKKQETIDEWWQTTGNNQIEEKVRRTSLDGGYGHVCAIGAAVGDKPVEVFYYDYWQEYESLTLCDFYDYLCDNFDLSKQIRPVFVGHNIASFDLKFLFQRTAVLGIGRPSFLPTIVNSWDNRVFDTMYQWGGRDYISLDNLCHILGIDEKGTEIGEKIDGSMVWDFVKDGKIDLVAKYCAGDVERVRQIYRRLTITPV